MVEALRFGKQEKVLQFSFQISVNVLRVNGISVIYIVVPKLFSQSQYNYVNSYFGLTAPHKLLESCVGRVAGTCIFRVSAGSHLSYACGRHGFNLMQGVREIRNSLCR